MIDNIFLNRISTIFFISFFIFGSCGENKKKDEGFLLHPDPDNFPYKDLKSEYISQQVLGETEQFPSLPDKIRTISQYLKKDHQFTSTNIDLLLGNYESILVKSLSNERVVLLDKRNNIFYDYDIKSNKKAEIATYGRGSGGIAHSSDLLQDAYNKFYISMRDGRIGQFDCSDFPCSHEQTMLLREFTPYSISINEEIISAIGMKPVTGSEGNSKTELKNNPIHIFNSDGEFQKSVGEGYDSKGNWMLIRPFTDGIIRYDEVSDNFIIFYHRLPFIYLYDSDFNILEKFEIKDFMLGKQKYWPKEGRLSIVMEDHSTINNIYPYSGGWFVLEVETKTDMKEEEYSYVWNRSSSFYALNFKNEKSVYLGKARFGEASNLRAFYITNHGILSYRKQNLEWVAF